MPRKHFVCNEMGLRDKPAIFTKTRSRSHFSIRLDKTRDGYLSNIFIAALLKTLVFTAQ